MFLPCYVKGCNKKYKTEIKWFKHLEKDHNISNPTHIPEKVSGDSGKNPTSQFNAISKIESLKKQQEEIKNLIKETETLTSTYEPIKRVERLNKCNICLEMGQFENIMIARQCGHGGFCSNCLNSYSLEKCPICRTKTSFVKLFI